MYRARRWIIMLRLGALARLEAWSTKARSLARVANAANEIRHAMRGGETAHRRELERTFEDVKRKEDN